MQEPTPLRRNRKRLTIDLHDHEHRVLKGFAAEAGVTMRVLVVKLLRREGLLSRTRRRKTKELDAVNS